MVYAMEQQGDDDPDGRDINNEAFWQKLQDVLEQTREAITLWAEEQGIDLETLELEAAKKEDRRRRDKAQNHELTQAAHRYGKMVNEWFESEPLLAARPDDLEFGTTPLTEDEPSLDQDEDVYDAVEVIGWYQHQIEVKLARGLMEREDEADAPEPDDDWQKNSDGSVKVSLIGMDRSIMAWGKLLRHFPEKADRIRPILLHLERLRRKTEHTFPGARKFLRPGFDMPAQPM
jgi:hypothetical protein